MVAPHESSLSRDPFFQNNRIEILATDSFYARPPVKDIQPESIVSEQTVRNLITTDKTYKRLQARKSVVETIVERRTPYATVIFMLLRKSQNITVAERDVRREELLRLEEEFIAELDSQSDNAESIKHFYEELTKNTASYNGAAIVSTIATYRDALVLFYTEISPQVEVYLQYLEFFARYVIMREQALKEEHHGV